MKQHPNRDFVAEAIADYMAMPQAEQSALLLSILDDQPYLMGFVTNLSDEFSDAAHEAIVESIVILINAFVSAGIPVDAIPQAILDEVLEEKLDEFESEEAAQAPPSDSPMVFEDLRNRALFYSDLDKEDELSLARFELVLNTVISVIERGVAVEINNGKG